MPDDERSRRRLSDATKGRIDDLASGWSVDSAESAEEPPEKATEKLPRRGDDTKARIAELASGWTVDGADTPEDAPAITPDAPSPRKRQKTLPPPPPGSAERRALEEAIVESNTGPAPKSDAVRAGVASTSGAVRAPASPSASGPARGKAPTAPPPLPPARKPTGAAPVVGGSGPTKVGSQSGSIAALPMSAALASQAKSAANAKPPSTTKSGPTETGTVNVSGVIGGTPAPVIIKPGQVPGVGAGIKEILPLRADTTDRSGPSTAMPPPTPPKAPPARPPIAQALPDESGEATDVDPNAHLTVPIGEFDQPATLLDQDKLRLAYEQSTIKRDAASALLSIPEQPLTVVKEPPVEMILVEKADMITRGDATSIDPQTARFERGDPTLGPDATTIDPPGAQVSGGKLRTQAALRRKRGIGGDVKYVATVLLGVRRARRELSELEVQQAQRLKSRQRNLLTLGRTAVITEGYDHPALSKAREALAVVEDERAQHTAAVTAADSELMRVRTDRAEKAKAYAEMIAATDAELADIAKKLEPLEKEVSSATKKAAELHESLRRIDAQIAATEASKVAVKSQKTDPAAIQAELASLKADRVAVERDEPRIAAELDALNPRIAALEARRAEIRKLRIVLDDEEKKDQGRAQELLAAIGAKRVVVDRAAADAEAARDKTMLELGERIYVDRPPSMAAQLAPIDAIDVELGTTDRRTMELKEILSSIDKAKLARGILVIVFVVGAVGTFVGWLLSALG